MSHSNCVIDGADDRWDALGPSTEKVKDEDDTTGVKTVENGEDVTEGRIWRLQAHARNSITAMKIDPVNGSGVSLPSASQIRRLIISSSPLHTIVHSVTSTFLP